MQDQGHAAAIAPVMPILHAIGQCDRQDPRHEGIHRL